MTAMTVSSPLLLDRDQPRSGLSVPSHVDAHLAKAGRRPSDRVTEPCCVLGPSPVGHGFIGVLLKAIQQVGGRTLENTVFLDKPENRSGNGVCFKGYLDRLSPVVLVRIDEVVLGPAQNRANTRLTTSGWS